MLMDFFNNAAKAIGTGLGNITSIPGSIHESIGGKLRSILDSCGRKLGAVARFPLEIINNFPGLVAGGATVLAFGCGAIPIAAYIAYQIYKKKKDLGFASPIKSIGTNVKKGFDKARDAFLESKITRM